MPPTKLKVYCLQCPHRDSGYFPQVLNKADKHADKTGHEMSAFTSKGVFYCNIHPGLIAMRDLYGFPVNKKDVW